ncbi:BnaC02g25360D [Brassica napus]|uniref:(rape) hypothetical protein n=1 Tax=Brassica napus TaxID=3708 RepID=A0A078GA22_BRANA|nr:unnamed protein product [Brassica napus]CDY22229.1 BnaC02g25330D [Brassica napus]CDY22232.1 BnaC02g25360D [Brassica napus]
MAHYNKLDEVVYNESLTCWRFRVKILRIHMFYSYVTGGGPNKVYILADEDGAKMEMTVNELTAQRFRGLEKQGGKWVEIFWNIHDIPHISNMNRNYPIDIMGVIFDTEAHFDDPATPKMVFYIRDNIESQIKCVATAGNAYAFRDGFESMRDRGQLCLETNGGLSDFMFNPCLEEVEKFGKLLNNNDPYVRRHGAVGTL